MLNISMVEDKRLEMIPTEAPPLQFGRVTLSSALEAFRRELSDEVMDLLRSLPRSVHTDAVVCLMKHFGAPFLPAFDLFRNYFTPAWSILYWLEQKAGGQGCLSPEDRRNARTAHAMALFLHPLDDHLNDGQLPPTHVHLLLRSEAWRRMCTALEGLAGGLSGGKTIVDRCLDDYYASIGSPAQEKTLDGYCRHFRGQMATWTCVPRLLAAKTTAEDGFWARLEGAFAGFGTAWRLLDDLQDAAIDYRRGHHSAVYCALPMAAKALWDQGPQERAGRLSPLVERAVRQGGVKERLMGRIVKELAAAAASLDSIGMGALAKELRDLAAPIRNGQAAW